MAKLVLSSEGTILQQCFIVKHRLSIGRDSQADLVIDDPAVSRAHAAVITVGNDRIVEDLGTVNGTCVNGKPIKRHLMQHADVIEIGKYQIRYLNQRAAAGTDFDRTMHVDLEHSGLTPSLGNAQTRTKSGAATESSRRIDSWPHGNVRFTKGPNAGTILALDRVVTTLGAPAKQVLAIARRPSGYFVTCVQGKRHARVNGTIIGDTPRPLQDGDVIRVFDGELEFLLG
jgi:pSer/pThr/pTyr-binding forkhead associated (FHA) protein